MNRRDGLGEGAGGGRGQEPLQGSIVALPIAFGNQVLGRFADGFVGGPAEQTLSVVVPRRDDESFVLFD
jgi:hypothetical protein